MELARLLPIVTSAYMYIRRLRLRYQSIIDLIHPPEPYMERQTNTPGTTSPTLFDKCVGSLTSPANHATLKMQETGPTVYSPYPRRLECLII